MCDFKCICSVCENDIELNEEDKVKDYEDGYDEPTYSCPICGHEIYCDGSEVK